MPERKLSQEDLDELRAATDEIARASHPKQIVRSDGIGNSKVPGWTGPKVLTRRSEIAAWKGISESHLFSLRRAGFQQKRGAAYTDQPVNGAVVPAEVLRATFELLQERLEVKDRRIRDLEDELEALRDRP